jgi:hypothetical protein
MLFKRRLKRDVPFGNSVKSSHNDWAVMRPNHPLNPQAIDCSSPQPRGNIFRTFFRLELCRTNEFSASSGIYTFGDTAALRPD